MPDAILGILIALLSAMDNYLVMDFFVSDENYWDISYVIFNKVLLLFSLIENYYVLYDFQRPS